MCPKVRDRAGAATADASQLSQAEAGTPAAAAAVISPPILALEAVLARQQQQGGTRP